MSLDKKHYSPNKEDRVCKYYHPIYQLGGHSIKEFQRIEDLLDEMTVDYCNGYTKSDIFLRLRNGVYKNGKSTSKKAFDEYWRAIQSRLAIDRERDVEQAKDALYAKYMALYQEAVEAGMTVVAKTILDSLMKLMGVDKPQQQQINIQPDNGEIKISFGFNNGD